jgi:hypothetical protein
MGYALFAQPIHGFGLCAPWNVELLRVAIEQGDFNLRAKGCFGEPDLHAVVEVIANPLESRVLCNAYLGVHITRLGVSLACAPLAVQSQACAGLNALRNLNSEFLFTADTALTLTHVTRVIDPFPRAAAIRTIHDGHHRAEKSLPCRLHASVTIAR